MADKQFIRHRRDQFTEINGYSAVRTSSFPFDVEFLIKGKYFHAGELFVDVATNDMVNIVFENPAGSGVRVYVFPQNIRTEGKVYVDKALNLSSYSGGSALTYPPVNKNSGFNGGESVSLSGNVTSTSGGKFFSTRLIGSNTAQSRIGGSADNPGLLIMPGDNLFIEATNVSQSNEDISIDFDWIEDEI